MELQTRVRNFGLIFVAIILVTGLVLMYKGNDPIALGVENKEGILTAEQVKVSFDSVGGRMISESVQEAQFVKKGDVLGYLHANDEQRLEAAKDKFLNAYAITDSRPETEPLIKGILQ